MGLIPIPLVDEVIELDKESRETQQEADDLRASRNKISKEIGGLMKDGKKEEALAFTGQVLKDCSTFEDACILNMVIKGV